MTKAKVTSFIRRDIRKLDKLQKIEVKKHPETGSNKKPNGVMIAYVITRKNTLKEILAMLEA